MLTSAGSHIRLEDVEFDDLSKGLAARWRFKAPSSLQQTTPQQEEVVLIPTKTAETGLLSLGQDAGCSWAQDRVAGNRALILKSSKAPVTSKLLRLSFLSQDSFFRSGTQPKLKEVAAPYFLIPQDEGIEGWKGSFST